MTATYKWQEVYKAAVLETDWSKMEERIRAAEIAIHARKNEFRLDHGDTLEENQAIAEAVGNLSILRADVALWSKQKSRQAN